LSESRHIRITVSAEVFAGDTDAVAADLGRLRRVLKRR
jgi:hypothetical protein